MLQEQVDEIFMLQEQGDESIFVLCNPDLVTLDLAL